MTVFSAGLIAFAASLITVSTGGTSLITVPTLIWLGLSPPEAVASNMFALIFLSISGALRFKGSARPFPRRQVLLFTLITSAGSFIGAGFILFIDMALLRVIIGLMVICTSCILFFSKNLGISGSQVRYPWGYIAGLICIFFLGIYGGFLSGGYVTLLSYVFLVLMGYDFIQTAFMTKVLNIFSSVSACIIFYSHGLINPTAGISMALGMAAGGWLGAGLAVSKGNAWIKRLFLAVSVALAVRLFI